MSSARPVRHDKRTRLRPIPDCSRSQTKVDFKQLFRTVSEKKACPFLAKSSLIAPTWSPSGGETLARVSLLSHDLRMRAFTIKAAKAHLNELVESAEAGEQVVLMRGAKHVAAIVPIDESQLELAIDLMDVQAARLWRQLASEQSAAGTAVFSSAEKAVQHLSKSVRRQRHSQV